MNQTTNYNINLKQAGYADRYFIRVVNEGSITPSFSSYGDTLLIEPSYDTDNVYNITTGQGYTYGGEQGTKIPDINEFPLTQTEINNIEEFKKLGWL